MPDHEAVITGLIQRAESAEKHIAELAEMAMRHEEERKQEWALIKKGIEERKQALVAERDAAVARAEMVEAEHATLMSMAEKAASVLREFADFDQSDNLKHPTAVVRAKAKNALKALREIAGVE